MGRTTNMIKAAGAAVATIATISATLRDNPQIGSQVSKAFDRVRQTTTSRSPKQRFDARLDAVEACADAVDEAFPDNQETREWRRRVKGLRVRGELLWSSIKGRERRTKLKELDAEAVELLSRVQERLVSMSNGEAADGAPEVESTDPEPQALAEPDAAESPQDHDAGTDDAERGRGGN